MIKTENESHKDYLRRLSDEEFKQLLLDAGFEVEEGNGEFINKEDE